MTTTLTKIGSTAKFSRLVKARMKRGLTRRAAVKETARRNPKLHALSLIESSPRASVGVKNDVRERGGLRVKAAGTTHGG